MDGTHSNLLLLSWCVDRRQTIVVRRCIRVQRSSSIGAHSMFRKRNVNAAERGAVLRAQETIADDGPADGEDESSVVKRAKPTHDDRALDEGEPTEEKAPMEEIFDGSEIEEKLEAKRKAAAVVDVDSSVLQSKKADSKFGPTSAPVYMRATTIVDYKPDLCKDYNETGYCGYGDACIYLHDRTTYVSGNILDQRWDEMMKKKKQGAVETKVESTQNDAICNICKSVMRPPMVKTRCGHKFCRNCAMDRFEKSPTCATCGMQTLGIFNEVKG